MPETNRPFDPVLGDLHAVAPWAERVEPDTAKHPECCGKKMWPRAEGHPIAYLPFWLCGVCGRRLAREI